MANENNRLINSRSPYLRQHALNPVNWYPWGEEAFEKAGSENKIIFLSIGYSACHWCHVMAHESFENDSIADLMNQLFVNIKVDREEYPDVDHFYQTFVQMTSGQGGWPLSVFLTADRMPVFGGTYFPSTSKYGRISFPDLCLRIEKIYREDPEKIRLNQNEIKTALKRANIVERSNGQPDFEAAFNRLYNSLKNKFDPKEGGFSSAPKFPHVSDIDFLMNYYFFTGKKEAKGMAIFSLSKMMKGGIYDQLGGGFHRYSTDEKWLVPHFEKMLYDNALLIPLLVNAFRLSGQAEFKETALATADFVLSELTDRDGGFYSTLDADSEGEEGKYYIWNETELRQLLPEKSVEILLDYWNVSARGNFEGQNILHRQKTEAEIVNKYALQPVEFKEMVQFAKAKLMSVRAKRIRPGLDDKILTDWNGMTISALWQVFQISGDKKYADAAIGSLEYIRREYLSDENYLTHFKISDQNQIPGYLDDYAYFIQALIDGFEVQQNPEYLKLAVQLTETVLTLFYDEAQAALFFTSAQHDELLVRSRDLYDTSTPSGNSIMLLNLIRLGHYTGNKQFLDIGEGLFQSQKNEIENQGIAMASALKAAMLHHFGLVEITSSGSGNLSDEIDDVFIPAKILVRNINNNGDLLVNPALLEGRFLEQGEGMFICFQQTCALPVSTKKDVLTTINNFKLYTD